MLRRTASTALVALAIRLSADDLPTGVPGGTALSPCTGRSRHDYKVSLGLYGKLTYAVFVDRGNRGLPDAGGGLRREVR